MKDKTNSKSIRVAYFTHYTDMYGANRSLIEMIRTLKKIGIESIVITPKKGELNELLSCEGIKNKSFRFYSWVKFVNKNEIDENIPRMKTMKRYIRQYISVLRISFWLKFMNIDIIHSNSSAINIGALVAERLKKAHIWHIREYGLEDYNIQYTIPFDKAVEFIENKSEKVIFISKNLLLTYKNYFKNPSKYMVIYDGVEKDEYYHLRNKKSFLQKLKIVVCGLIHFNKNQKEVIKAISLLDDNTRKNIEVHFIGGGDPVYIKSLKQYVNNKKITNTVYFHDYMKEINAFIKVAHIAIMPSRKEAFGRVTVEYMLSGLGVIASDSGANPEIIENNVTGLLYKLGNEIELSEKIIRFVSDRSFLYQCALNGQNKALNFFTSKHNSSNVNEVYKSLIEKRN